MNSERGDRWRRKGIESTVSGGLLHRRRQGGDKMPAGDEWVWGAAQTQVRGGHCIRSPSHKSLIWMETGKSRDRSPLDSGFILYKFVFLSLAQVMFLQAPQVVYVLIKIPTLYGATDTFSGQQELVPIAQLPTQQGPIVVSLWFLVCCWFLLVILTSLCETSSVLWEIHKHDNFRSTWCP